MICKKCGGSQYCKAGKVKFMQRYKCKLCQSTFTNTLARGRPLFQKLFALTLWQEGMSLNKIAKQFDLSVPAVWKWIGALKKKNRAESERF